MVCLSVSAQKVYDTFTAFGEIPQVVENELYIKLNTAENQEQRFQYLDTISQIYLKAGHADSLMHYGKRIKNDAFYRETTAERKTYYKLKGLYYEGVAAQKMGLLEAATESFIEGIESSASRPSIHNYLKLRLAEVYLSKGELEKAKSLLEELPQEKSPHHFYLNNILIKSRYLMYYGDYDLASEMMNEALTESFIEDFPKLRLELNLNWSELELRQGEFLKVLNSTNAIKKEALKLGFYDLYIQACLDIGYANAMLDEFEV
ncbi:MAG: hypothetical protein ABJ218_15125, partial [Winogradskyella arenosi]